MSRSGYSDDCENVAMWRGMVASATRGKRGQRFFRELVAALDAMPEKRLIAGELQEGGEVCAIGALGRAKGIDMSAMDPEDAETVAPAFDIATCLAQEVVYVNDEQFGSRHETYDGRNWKRVDYTPEERWAAMRAWAAKQITASLESTGERKP